jgi:o-succinylbenzoate---CoA ligase
MFKLQYKENQYSENELKKYPESLPYDLLYFLKSWFNKDDYISVKTSGSTGKPKNIKLKKEILIKSALRSNDFFELNENTTALQCLSCNFIAGKLMVIRALVGNFKLIIEDPSQTPLKNINEKIDFVAMIPAQIQESFEKTPNKIDFINKIIIGGGSINDALKKTIISSSMNAFSTYGMTETATHIAIQKIQKHNDYFVPLKDVRIYTNSDNCLIIDDKYTGVKVETNDIIKIESNKFKYLGRKDNIINTGGIKIQSEVIESKILKHINTNYFIYGISDPKWGQKVILILEGENLKIDLTQINNELEKREKIKAVYNLKKFIYTKTKKINRVKTAHLITTV